MPTYATEPEALIALEGRVSRALVKNDPLRARLETAAEDVERSLRCAAVAVWQLGDGADDWTLVATASEAGVQSGVMRATVAEVAASRHPIVRGDAQVIAAACDAEWAARLGLVAFVGCPLVVDEEVVGVMTLFAARSLTRAELTALDAMSLSMAQALKRASVHRLLRERELWLTTTLASIGDGVVTTDASSRVTYLNAVASSLTGWSNADAVGRPLAEIFPIFHETTLEPVDSPVDRALREGRIVGLANHTVLRHRDGRLTPVEDSAAPIRESDGPILGVVLVFRDATKERREQRAQKVELERAQEDEARTNHALIRSDFLLEVAGALAAGVDIDEALRRVLDILIRERVSFASVSLVDANGLLQHRCHLPYDERIAALNGQHAATIASSESYPPRRALLSKTVIVHNDLAGSAADDLTEQYNVVASSLALAHSAFIPIVLGERSLGVLTVARPAGLPFLADDVAVLTAVAAQLAFAVENARLYAEARAMRHVAEAATRAKDDFLARVSHDLRSPLGSILGWAGILEKNPDDAALRGRALATIQRNARAQVQLVEELLDVARIVSGTMQLDIVTQDVRDALEAALDPARVAADAKDVALTVTIDPDVGSIAADSARLRQVVWNLAANAVKFTPAGGTIRVTAQRAESELLVSIVDSGKGITPELLVRMFQPWQQDEGRTTRQQGLGLGLSIVRQIVELHGGRVWAESDGVGTGARFSFTLPIRAAVIEEGSDRTLSDWATPLVGVRALCVDDEQDARDIVAEILRRAGAVVTSVASADEAYAQLRSHPPDVLVSDVQMPGADGFDLIRRVRALPADAGGRTPAIALTAMARPLDRLRLLGAGFTTHATKPIEARELVIVLASLLGRDAREQLDESSSSRDP